jgi:hypothetical protein
LHRHGRLDAALTDGNPYCGSDACALSVQAILHLLDVHQRPYDRPTFKNE